MDGFINVLKPPGMSSHDVVGFIRRVYDTKKVGHAGTLGAGAAGVLPVAIGKATRLLEYINSSGKAYRAEVSFGMETDTCDDLGNVVRSKADFSLPDDDALRHVLSSFEGKIKQVPPVYSALKINGEHAYDLARENENVVLPERTIEIHKICLVKRYDTRIIIDVDCSKGTYIRSLCRDIGKRLDIPATMSFLIRRRAGAFPIEDALTLEEIEAAKEAAVQAPEKYLSLLPKYILPENRIKPFINGLPTHIADAEFSDDERVVIFAPNGVFIGVSHFDGSTSSIVPDKIYTNIL